MRSMSYELRSIRAILLLGYTLIGLYSYGFIFQRDIASERWIFLKLDKMEFSELVLLGDGVLFRRIIEESETSRLYK